MTNCEATVRREIEARLAEARQSLSGLVLRDRDVLLGAVLAAAKSLIPDAARSPGYQELLSRDLAQGLSYLDGLAVEVRTAPAHQQAVARLLEPHPRATWHSDSTIAGGIRLVADSGAVVVDATLEGRLEAGWPELRIAVARDIEAPG